MDIQCKVAALRDPAVYPDHPATVEVIETHFSWVFLTAERVYKLKKPVRYHGMDFTPLAARRRNCEQEFALNRRLAPAVYLGLAALTRNPTGGLELDGAGPVLDWLVVMRRLPAAGMLDAAIRRGGVDTAALERIAALLVGFYRTARPTPLDPDSYRQRFARAVAEAHAVLCTPGAGLDRNLIATPRNRLERFLSDRGALLGARAGRLVDAHGDLRPEHICLTPAPAIIDCLEFDADLRQLDPVDELAYLALECERLGAPAIGHRILASYRTLSGDDCAAELVDFYRVFRACVRAKIAIWHLADCAPGEYDHWRRRARDYLILVGDDSG